ncbi:MAG: hypothetical protein B7X10_05610, partial [Burkholderiales bacterium 21-58-4]
MSLTDTKIKQCKPKGKPYKLSDEKGLYLEIAPSGGKWWRLKYRIEGREKRLSLGVYPDVTLAQAREKRDDHRKLIAQGIDPSAARKAQKQATADTFESVAREWFGKRRVGWADSHAQKVIRRLERELFPWLGSRPVSEIKPADLLAALRRTEARAAETAHRVLQISGQIFRYAVATGRAEIDPTPSLRGALQTVKKNHYAAITNPQDISPLLRKINTYKGSLEVQSALRLIPHVFTRPSELRLAKWEEIDWESQIWNLPPERMKMKLPHVVPLSDQALAILKELQPLTGESLYIFRSPRQDKPISSNTLNKALRTIIVEAMTGELKLEDEQIENISALLHGGLPKVSTEQIEQEEL